jgi:hypothetical protein
MTIPISDTATLETGLRVRKATGQDSPAAVAAAVDAHGPGGRAGVAHRDHHGVARLTLMGRLAEAEVGERRAAGGTGLLAGDDAHAGRLQFGDESHPGKSSCSARRTASATA